MGGSRDRALSFERATECEELGDPEDPRRSLCRDGSAIRRKSMGDHRINRELEQVRKVLGKMDSKGAEAVEYMPVQLKKLPAHLKKCAVEILLNDTLAGSFGQPFEISPNSLSIYRFRHDSPEKSYFIDQIAQHLGWQS